MRRLLASAALIALAVPAGAQQLSGHVPAVPAGGAITVSPTGADSYYLQRACDAAYNTSGISGQNPNNGVVVGGGVYNLTQEVICWTPVTGLGNATLQGESGFPAGRALLELGGMGTVAVSSATYNSGTGLVTLTLASSPILSPGDTIVVSGLTGTGSFASADGTFTAGPGTAAGTFTYTIATGLTLTITGGNVTNSPAAGMSGVASHATVSGINFDGNGFAARAVWARNYNNSDLCNSKLHDFTEAAIRLGDASIAGHLNYDFALCNLWTTRKNGIVTAGVFTANVDGTATGTLTVAIQPSDLYLIFGTYSGGVCTNGTEARIGHVASDGVTVTWTGNIAETGIGCVNYTSIPKTADATLTGYGTAGQPALFTVSTITGNLTPGDFLYCAGGPATDVIDAFGTYTQGASSGTINVRVSSTFGSSGSPVACSAYTPTFGIYLDPLANITDTTMSGYMWIGDNAINIFTGSSKMPANVGGHLFNNPQVTGGAEFDIYSTGQYNIWDGFQEDNPLIAAVDLEGQYDVVAHNKPNLGGPPTGMTGPDNVQDGVEIGTLLAANPVFTVDNTIVDGWASAERFAHDYFGLNGGNLSGAKDSGHTTNAYVATPATLGAAVNTFPNGRVEAGVTFASLPSASANAGLVQFVTDVGINGSYWKSDGTNWNPTGRITLCEGSVDNTVTGSTAETELEDCAITANIMGTNRSLRAEAIFSYTADATLGACRIRFNSANAVGGTIVNGDTETSTSVTTLSGVTLTNKSATNSQIAAQSNSGPNGGVGAAGYIAASIQTSSTSYVIFTRQNGATGDAGTIKRWSVELVP
ncbi:MAG TPA: hypothetical protein VGS12_02550 [Caulobacteraceae bacterium]|nr:hypothetical protein [Caulobacteraceae bacterium]